MAGLVSDGTEHLASRRTPIVLAVEKALPSVVNIGTEKLVKMRYADPKQRFRNDAFNQLLSEFFGFPHSEGYQLKNSLGSGVIIDPRGYILSNYHVIERASKIRVTLSDEKTYEGTFLAGDQLSDLALIKIDPETPLKAIEFAEDDELLLGETVIVLGNPFGLAGTVTVGVLSAKNREANYKGQVLFSDILQTDAAVNPGSSGGPLLNIDGDLIGINVAIYQQAQNIGFAVPIKRARELAGLWLSPRLTGRLTMGFDVRSSEDGKLRVSRVDADGKAAVSVGDEILAVNGKPVDDVYDYHKALLDYEAGDVIPLLVEKTGGERGIVEVAMLGLPLPSGSDLAKRFLGIKFADLEPQQERKQVRYGQGMLIDSVDVEGPADEAGLESGIVITRIGRNEVKNLTDVGFALEDIQSGDKVTLGVLKVRESGAVLIAQRSVVNLTAR